MDPISRVRQLPLLGTVAGTFARVWETKRAWLVFRLLCALVWAIELYWVQSLAFEAPPWVRFPGLVQGFRFYLDLVSALIPVLLLQRRFLNPLLVVNLALVLVIGTYVQTYHWPLMPIRAFSQWREAWSLHPNVLHLLPWRPVALALATYAVKLALLVRSGSYFLAFPGRLKTGMLALLAYFIPILALQTTQLRLRAGTNGGYGRTVYAYGYSLSWVCDIISNAQVRKHQQRAEGYLNRSYDRISPLERPLPVGKHIVVLQLESVCPNAVEARC